jgi:hypothetical protein
MIMTAEEIRLFIKRQPFRPFTIYMTDGRKLVVPHPDFVFLPPGWSTTAIVALPKGLFEFVYIRNITSIKSDGEIPTHKGRARRNGGDDPETSA